jgi:hypothetical protein
LNFWWRMSLLVQVHLAVFFLHRENGDFSILIKDILIENIPISISSKTTCQHVFCWATQPYSAMLDLAHYKPNQANSLCIGKLSCHRPVQLACLSSLLSLSSRRWLHTLWKRQKWVFWSDSSTSGVDKECWMEWNFSVCLAQEDLWWIPSMQSVAPPTQ